MLALYYPLAAFLICLAATPAVQWMAHKRDWLAHPTADRWHQKPTALMGGIAIYTGISIPLYILSDFTLEKSFVPGIAPMHAGPHAGAVLWLGVTLLFTLGLVDDFLKIKPQSKLLGQILVALMATFFGYRLCWFESMTLDTMISVFWIVGITNALNLLDNMDGLCAGVGAVASFFLAMLLWDTNFLLAVMSLILCGSLAAFLVFNFNPASIFMGDCGSLVIGFTLAFLSICYAGFSAPPHGIAKYACPIMVMMVPIFDTSLVTFIRLLSGRKASMGGKDHTSHRLVLIGLSEKKAALALYAIASISGLAAMFVDRHDTLSTPLVLVPLALAILLMGVYLAQLRVYPEKEFSVLRDKTFTPVLMELTYKRQLALVVLDFWLIAFSYYMSYRLRFNIDDFKFYFEVFLQSLPIIIGCKITAFYAMGVYRGVWDSFSFNDIYVHIKATMLGTLLSVVLITYVFRFQDFSKGLFVIDWLGLTGLVLLTRGSFRLFMDAMKRSSLKGDRVLLYGAGRGGEILLREIMNNKHRRLVPAGFLDDDPMKAGKRLQGYPVHAAKEDLDALLAKEEVRGIVIAYINPSEQKMARLKEICRKNQLFLKKFSVCIEDVEV
ncbi:UDP-GlcNAc:undecaprenyl-phosphate GlcNAc-1-phosphate transferase [Desulfatibacillum alkenivorans DSM 16219]|uniref:UDP-GlcNAc:undecaprenyl-phosphate GlcNAc-1-phosphate transferase n=2 Tax=Desulfatibacillum alkenivorans TaxID=259354 RepID=A0A1M6V8B7_9BACT|nr:UDP-GlcNAc:undecaprenyl-phosphate GlcNAc-1-phosphate transferase [Desulfatibacillum alkenivorans DSM 16219]